MEDNTFRDATSNLPCVIFKARVLCLSPEETIANDKAFLIISFIPSGYVRYFGNMAFGTEMWLNNKSNMKKILLSDFRNPTIPVSYSRRQIF